MTLNETIYMRKTTRSFDMTPLDKNVLDDIRAFGSTLKSLDTSIKTRFEIIGIDSVKCILPWKTPHYIAVFSEEKEGYLTNAGFMFQQLDLYMQSLGIGCCWLGMGKYNPGEEVERASDLPFVIMISFGRAKGSPHRELSEFKRKPLAEISDIADERLESAHLAPSGKNAQPWFFLHDGDVIHTYHVHIPRGLLKKKEPDNVSFIDVGCALAHMYVANSDTFHFFKQAAPSINGGYTYIGSFKI